MAVDTAAAGESAGVVASVVAGVIFAAQLLMVIAESVSFEGVAIEFN